MQIVYLSYDDFNKLRPLQIYNTELKPFFSDKSWKYIFLHSDLKLFNFYNEFWNYIELDYKKPIIIYLYHVFRRKLLGDYEFYKKILFKWVDNFDWNFSKFLIIQENDDSKYKLL